MDSATVQAVVDNLVDTIETFLDEFEERDVPPHRITAVIEGDDQLAGDDLRQHPERFVEDYLIWEVLDALDYKFTPRPNSPVGGADDLPDFRVDNLPSNLIGENKSVNDIKTAREELRLYLDSARHEYGIATDGFEWGLYCLEEARGGELKLSAEVEPFSIKPVVQYYARERGLGEGYTDDLSGLPDPEIRLASFFQSFGHHTVRRQIGGLRQFHDKYAEVITGDGEYDHEGIRQPLVKVIESPEDAGDASRLAFSALLIDRLAFLQLMQDRGVVDFRLREEWDEHDQGLNRWRGSFYETCLQPLFYDVLSVIPSAREDNLSSFGRPPRFGGGLFEPILPDEKEYDLSDEVMRDLLSVFIEGESRTVINEAVRGSLLESHQEVDAQLAGRTAQWYRDVTEAYDAELEYVEENIHSTLRRFTE